MQQGHKRLGISLATGSGKTVIFTQLIDRVNPFKEHGKQTLILVHRKELVEQAEKHCRLAYPNKTIEIEMGSNHATGTADITVASIRSLISSDRIEKFDPGRFKLVLVDEAHHIVAPSYRRVLQHFLLDKLDNGSPALVGVSATFSRFDGLRLGTAIDHIVYHKDYVDMIGEKWLADAIFTTVKSHVKLNKVGKSKDGDFHARQLSAAVNTDKANDITVNAWLSRAKKRKSTLVFCVDIEHVTCLTNKFRYYGIDARFITGQTSKDVRTRELDGFRNQEYPVLVNCGLFTEGTDIPNIDCVLLARPTRSRNLLIQMIGRGLRLHPGKQDCHVIDMVAALETGVVTTPTLFGLHPDEGLENTPVHDFDKIRQKNAIDLPQELETEPDSAEDEILVKFTDYDSVHDLVMDTSGEKHIRSLSVNAWVRVDENRYILNAPGGILELDDKDGVGLFSVYQTMALPSSVKSKSPFGPPKEVASSLNLTDAVHAADTLAGRIFGSTAVSLFQGWRNARATDRQIRFLRSALGLNKQRSKHITRGQAAYMITKLRHGAKGRFKEIVKTRVNNKKLEKLKELKKREEVRVGPLNES
ncbi:putative ATP-dependent helicase IRC3 [Ophidiomyces ophidiicola]|nr:putative ATP-dependent helicase IRC3 [Ophidiomyces ophidiicola]